MARHPSGKKTNVLLYFGEHWIASGGLMIKSFALLNIAMLLFLLQTDSAANDDSTPPLYATHILKGGRGKDITVVGMSDAGDRAILEREKGSKTQISLLVRSQGGWQEKSLLRRADKGIDPTLEAFDFSRDGRYLLIGYREELENEASWSIRILDVDSGELTVLLKEPREDTVFGRQEQIKKGLLTSGWLASRYSGREYRDVFPRKTRDCAEGNGISLSIEGDKAKLLKGTSSTSYALKDIIGADTASIGNWATAYSADCLSGLTTITEIHFKRPPLTILFVDLFGSNISHSFPHVVEFGQSRDTTHQ